MSSLTLTQIETVCYLVTFVFLAELEAYYFAIAGYNSGQTPEEWRLNRLKIFKERKNYNC